MTEVDSRAVLGAVFGRLRRTGFNLGVGELLDAYHALDGGFGGQNVGSLTELARLLWCHSVEEADQLADIVRIVLDEQRTRQALDDRKPDQRLEPRTGMTPPTEADTTSDRVTSGPAPAVTRPPPLPANSQPMPVPVRTPTRPFQPDATGPELRPYWPLSRRAMVYTWRQFRRIVRDGPRDEPDLIATIEQSIRQGFFIEPVKVRRARNRARLILLVDQGGSMVPFHRFTRDLVETACTETESRLRGVTVAYFQNLPSDHAFRDPHRTRPVSMAELLAEVDTNAGILVVSDAGAARGQRRPERIRTSAEFLAGLKRRTEHLAWLNPMPEARWAGSSAQFIARLAPMFQMDAEGFGRAIAVLRGQHPRPAT